MQYFFQDNCVQHHQYLRILRGPSNSYHIMKDHFCGLLPKCIRGKESTSWIPFSNKKLFFCKHTPPKTNIEPENEPLEEEISTKNHHFQVPC